ncbi:MAG: hypothetical protein RM021_002455 [Nostoc sp. EkiNYC01]|nr:hypothetical protein [Nostoc sp. EkiNYC01]
MQLNYHGFVMPAARSAVGLQERSGRVKAPEKQQRSWVLRASARG